MTSKFELTISTNYVPDWGYIEAFRELFQNAIDNEIENPENKMEFSYDNKTILISNKTSILEIDSLLLGNSTKKDDKNTIGKHGEGYKIAFMVLLREGKKVKVYNYGKREIWEARLVKSKRFNGQLIPTIFVQKEAIWKKVPNNNLIIEVADISESEFNEIKKKNLNIQDNVEYTEVDGYGKILTDIEKEAGNIYVKGLFICNSDKLKYGYDFEPHLISLDRDRRLMSDFNIQWNCSCIWKKAFIDNKLNNEIIDMVSNSVFDVGYITDVFIPTGREIGVELGNELATRFIEENGTDSTPVSSTDEMNDALKQGLKPVILPESVVSIIKRATNTQFIQIKKVSLKDKFEELLNKIEAKLSDEELNEFRGLIDEL